MTDITSQVSAILTNSTVLAANPVARFCYTATAYDNNVAAGVSSYSATNEQNIPLADYTDTDSAVLDSGFRATAASIPRMYINHFMGRLSYNLNKTVDFLNTFYGSYLRDIAQNCNEYSSTTTYQSGDVCFTTLDIDGTLYVFLTQYISGTAQSNVKPVASDGTVDTQNWTELTVPHAAHAAHAASAGSAASASAISGGSAGALVYQSAADATAFLPPAESGYVLYGAGSADTPVWNYFPCRASATAHNTFAGFAAGNANTTGSSNSFFGYQAGSANTTGASNSFFGASAGNANTTGLSNSFFGASAGSANTTGGSNCFFGDSAGSASTTGDSNCFFGASAGSANTTGAFNSSFGCQAGGASTGSYNCAFGYLSGGAPTGSNNASFGYQAGASVTSGAGNCFFGHNAGRWTSTGNYNIFIGEQAGVSNTSGNNGLAVGAYAGYANTSGVQDVFIGNNAGRSNTTGNANVFIGEGAGYSSTVNGCNVYIGCKAGYYMDGAGNNTDAINNTFVGYQAGQGSSTAESNTGKNNSFFGYQAGSANTTGDNNCFFGSSAGSRNTTGTFNSFFGYNAGGDNTTGDSNCFFGLNAGAGGGGNTTGSHNVYLGADSGFTFTSYLAHALTLSGLINIADRLFYIENQGSSGTLTAAELFTFLNQYIVHDVMIPCMGTYDGTPFTYMYDSSSSVKFYSAADGAPVLEAASRNKSVIARFNLFFVNPCNNVTMYN